MPVRLVVFAAVLAAAGAFDTDGAETTATALDWLAAKDDADGHCRPGQHQHDEDDDEAEDYKTYLERQKREQREKSRVIEKKYDESDYEDDYEEENECTFSSDDTIYVCYYD